MTIREILHHPDERLRTKAESVSKYDGKLETLVADMFETMYAAPGIGLAATQIDVHLKVIVVDCGKQDPCPLHFINPELIRLEGIEQMEEGCLQCLVLGGQDGVIALSKHSRHLCTSLDFVSIKNHFLPSAPTISISASHLESKIQVFTRSLLLVKKGASLSFKA